jgi:oxygen-independent coproporphyrinogen III oxidase
MNTLEFNTPNENDTRKYAPIDILNAGIHNHTIANTAYPIAHLKTMMDYRIDDSYKNEFAKKIWDWTDELWLYVHVPFCENRCKFCEYTVIDPTTNQDHIWMYFQHLTEEFKLYREQTDLRWKKLFGFDIWGGTPSLPDPSYIEKLLKEAGNTFDIGNDIDISIETTPKIAALDLDKMKAYKGMGINRISMWVQSVAASVLACSDRTNTSIEWNRQAALNIRKAGFEKYNIDMMYGLVGQTTENLKATVDHILSLDPEFVTIYRTRYKWTRMADEWGKIEMSDVTDQQLLIKDILLKAGYAWAEGKNTFSKINWNLGTSDYLTKRVVNWAKYLGMWLGAQSYSVKSLSYNSWAATKGMKEYYQDIEAWKLPIQDIYHLPKVASIAKFISVSFYFWWINLESFKNNFEICLEDEFKDEVKFVLENGFMEYKNGCLMLTLKWVKNFSWVISLFYAPGVKKYLLEKEI